jgi:predicted NAD/FAD-binding protein
MACHSDQALNLQQQPTAREKSILGAMGYQDNDVILHNDESIMPRNALSWASWNFLTGEANANEPPLVTYCMNILQGLNSPSPLLVSLNARHKINPQKILQEFSYAHPVFSKQSMAAQQRRQEICGIDRLHYCGAYWYSGFHEDGVRSALDVCERFGLGL